MPGRAARASHSMPREQSHVVRRIMRQAFWSTRHNHTRAQDEDIIHVLYCQSVSVSLTVYSMGDPLIIITYNYDCLFGVSLQSQHILAYGVRHVEVSLYLSVQDYRLYSRRSWPGSEDWKNIFIFCRASFPSSHPVTHTLSLASCIVTIVHLC